MDKREDNPKERRREPQKDFPEEVGAKEARKLKARGEKNRSVWFGLGMFGIVGWSVAIPTVLGIALGIWIDAHYPSRFSWTLTLLFLGVCLGSANAWFWVNRVGKNG
jgi:ATP synthase protein I